jgi:glycosyltransferase involved in cell wall biosynthesis
MLEEDGDLGPKEHVSSIFRHVSSFNIIGVSNVSNGIDSNGHFIYKVRLNNYLNTWFKLLLFQFFAAIFVIKKRMACLLKKEPMIVMQRYSAGFFLVSIVCFLFRIHLISEVNGLLVQDHREKGRGRIVYWVMWFCEYTTYHLSFKVIFVHKNIKNVISKLYQLNSNAVEVVENGTESFPWLDPEAPEDKFFVGYLGSLAHREGVDLLPDIANLLGDDIHFVVVGGLESDIDVLRDLACKKKVVDHFHFHSYKPRIDAMKILQKCHAFIHMRRPIDIMGSNSQGSPLKMLDYLNLGRPIIASNVQSYKFIQENNFGKIVDVYDPSSAATSIRQIKESYKEWIIRGHKAHDYVLDNHSWKDSISKVESILHSALVNAS